MTSSGKKVLLLYADKYYLLHQVYPFGLDLIADYLRRRGHKVEIASPFLPHRDFKKNVREALSRTRPDCVGLGIRNLDTCMSCEQYGDFKGDGYQTFYFLPPVKEIVTEIREAAPHIPVVVGGGAFTVSPVAILKYLGLDYGIVGEGEEPFCRFVEAFPDKERISQIPNMVHPRPEGHQVNHRKPYRFRESSGPDHRDNHFHYALQATGVPVQVKRGCHHRCSYCVEPLIEGRKYSFRDVDEIIEELHVIAHTMEAADRVFFVDTEFNLPDLRHGSQLVRTILREGLHERFRFVTQLIPKPFDLDVAGLLAEAGFSVIFSCESFSDKVLKKNGISYVEKDIIAAIEACEQRRLRSTISLIFGLPGETYDTMDYTLSRMRQYPVGPYRDYEYTVGGRIYQGTPLCEHVEHTAQSNNLYGTKSDGYLMPYYYCAPASPFEVHEYIRKAFPNTLCYDKQYDAATHQQLAIGCLSDHGLWEDAIDRFMESEVAVQASIYDYLFKKLLHAKRQDDARVISSTLLENIERSEGAIDPAQGDVVRFYLNSLVSKIF